MSSKHNDIWAIVLAAGKGSRLARATSGPKQYLRWKGRPLFWHSVATLAGLPRISGVVLVFPLTDLEAMSAEVDGLARKDDPGVLLATTAGGTRRQDSVRNGLSVLPPSCDAVLVHDAARPFASPSMIQSLIEALDQGACGAIPAIAVSDTIKMVDDGETVTQTLVRAELRAVQTPQAFGRKLLDEAHRLALEENWDVTDDASMLEHMGKKVRCLPGEESNVKITTPEDLKHLLEAAPPRPCVGWGYDVHRFGGERPLKLGGIEIPNGPGVYAHSDGDVLLHALTDAILGCLGLGDIGLHFPDTDKAWEGAESGVLLKEVLAMAARRGLDIHHVDLTVIAQVPKLSPWRDRIRDNVAALLQMETDRVNFKATTEEGSASPATKKGIKAVATVPGKRRLSGSVAQQAVERTFPSEPGVCSGFGSPVLQQASNFHLRAFKGASMQLYNTLHRTKETFTPAQPGRVSLYVCGITAYDLCHVGHARSAVVFDVLVRHLRATGLEVTFIRNFTDVDDKIIARALKENVSSEELAGTYIQAFYEDMDRLNILRADVEPRCTEHIPEMIALTEQLIARDNAYATNNGDVYFRVRLLPSTDVFPTATRTRCAPAPASSPASTRRTPWTLPSGKRPNPASPAGKAPGAAGVPDGTWSARPWPQSTSPCPWTFTAAART